MAREGKRHGHAQRGLQAGDPALPHAQPGRGRPPARRACRVGRGGGHRAQRNIPFGQKTVERGHQLGALVQPVVVSPHVQRHALCDGAGQWHAVGRHEGAQQFARHGRCLACHGGQPQPDFGARHVAKGSPCGGHVEGCGAHALHRRTRLGLATAVASAVGTCCASGAKLLMVRGPWVAKLSLMVMGSPDSAPAGLRAWGAFEWAASWRSASCTAAAASAAERSSVTTARTTGLMVSMRAWHWRTRSVAVTVPVFSACNACQAGQQACWTGGVQPGCHGCVVGLCGVDVPNSPASRLTMTLEMSQ